MTNSYSFDSHANESLAFHILAMTYFQKFGTAAIPYVEVAKEIMGWESEKTAKARLKDLINDGLVVMHFDYGSARTFVHVQDLAAFMMAKRTVTISKN